MNVTYRFVAGVAFFDIGARRYRRQHPQRLTTGVPIAIGIAAVSSVALYGLLFTPTWWPLPHTASPVIITAVTIALTTQLFTRSARFRRLPGFGDEVTTILNEDGVSVTSRNATASFGWPVFDRAARFSDGILLVSGQIYRWLPNSAIRDGTLTDALVLARKSKTFVEFV